MLVIEGVPWVMQFLIADTFAAALGRLQPQEQKAVKVTVFDLQQDPAAPGLQFHRIDKSKDRNFWSMRVGRDIRLVVHKTAASFLLCFVAHHDDAYAWAERRRIETHPRTGAVQIVEVRERVEEIAVPATTPAAGETPVEVTEPRPFVGLDDDALLDIGVPTDWLDDIRGATEDGFLELHDHLPAEAAEALLSYATTGKLPAVEATAAVVAESGVPIPSAEAPDISAFEREVSGLASAQALARAFAHPDAQRRFRILDNREELERALEYPWEKWMLYLHPAQRAVVERTFSGPARVAGSAGTGKTVVALHRAARILRTDPEARLLLTTFSDPLANMLSHKLDLLLAGEDAARQRAAVQSFNGVARNLYVLALGHDPLVARDEHVEAALANAAPAAREGGFSERFVMSEWTHVVDAWQVADLDGFAKIPRLGRRQRLGAKQRERLWGVFETMRAHLARQGRLTWPMVFAAVTDHFAGRDDKPYTHIVVDEAQDLGVPELRMLAAIAPEGPDRLFFSGDLGQRIFREPFSWRALGIDVRGRSVTLKVNYRTSHQIREALDRLLPGEIRDVDDNVEGRAGTVSVFNGPAPRVRLCDDADAERDVVAGILGELCAAGIAPEETAIFVRSRDELPRARAAVDAAGLELLELSAKVEAAAGCVRIGTMHLAKGLEFKAVVVMACDEEIVPLQSRVEKVADEAELTEVFETERHLLYVACTRARDRLFITGVRPGSEFIEDLGLAADEGGARGKVSAG